MQLYCFSKTLSQEMHSELNVINSTVQNQWREFHPILVTDAFGFIDVLISFWDQRVKGQGHSRQWPKNLVNTTSQKLMTEISPNLDHIVVYC